MFLPGVAEYKYYISINKSREIDLGRNSESFPWKSHGIYIEQYQRYLYHDIECETLYSKPHVSTE